jgi:hypothetical protein
LLDLYDGWSEVRTGKQEGEKIRKTKQVRLNWALQAK